jgi:hypothetical protein
VYVLPYQPIARQASPELCAQVSQVVETELGSAGHIHVLKGGEVPQAEPAEGASPVAENAEAPARKALDKALALASSGGNQVKKQKFDPAIKALTAALGHFQDAAQVVTDIGPVAQAHLDLAVAHWKRGREEEAVAQMAAAIRLHPDFKPDPKEYFPLFLRVYEQQWRKTLREPRGHVRVDATVPGAEVFFDGRSVGAVPLQLTNVVPGPHFLRVVKDGAGTFGARIEVPQDKGVEVTADFGGDSAQGGGLGPLATAVSANRVDEDAKQAAVQLGRAQNADYVLFGGVRKDESAVYVASFLVRLSDSKAARLVDLELDSDLLSASVEAFKLVEDLGGRLQDFGDPLPPGANTIVRGVDGAPESAPAITEVDVGPPVPEVQSRPERRLATTEGEGGDGDKATEGSGRAGIIGAADGESPRRGRRRNMRESGASTPEDYEPRRPFYQNPPVLFAAAGVAGAAVIIAVVVLVAGGLAGGAGAWYLLSPARSATVQTSWPK